MADTLARKDVNEIPNIMALTASRELRNVLVAENGSLLTQSGDYLVSDNVTINRNADGSIASVTTAIGANIRTETINRNPDGSILSVTVGVI